MPEVPMGAVEVDGRPKNRLTDGTSRCVRQQPDRRPEAVTGVSV